jgi:hypothetical protein
MLAGTCQAFETMQMMTNRRTFVQGLAGGAAAGIQLKA